jgi:hypothetical protein
MEPLSISCPPGTTLLFRNLSRRVLTPASLVQPFPFSNLYAQAPEVRVFNSYRERAFQENRGQIINKSTNGSKHMHCTLSDGNATLIFHNIEAGDKDATTEETAGNYDCTTNSKAK